ncbi:hypothetical protein [Silvimonas soli]|uniref:hypothetical protein n=1 Tax=Silvimonas soli TaxID=2980100 RepID=UPI0024B3691E|nr:hypothetical protein [Silvimonas soli]
MPAVSIAEAFDPQALQSAILGAQSGAVKYPEFMALTMAAGCVGYVAWIAGEQVTYMGRKGEAHIEPMPGAR